MTFNVHYRFVNAFYIRHKLSMEMNRFGQRQHSKRKRLLVGIIVSSVILFILIATIFILTPKEEEMVMLPSFNRNTIYGNDKIATITKVAEGHANDKEHSGRDQNTHRNQSNAKEENSPKESVKRINVEKRVNISKAKISNGHVQKKYSLKLPTTTIDLVKLTSGLVEIGGYPIWEKRNEPIKKSFSISTKEITLTQFKDFFPDKKTVYKYQKNFPITNVTWEEAVEFCSKATSYLRKTNQISKNESVKLPTEIQWEYAAKCDFCTDKASRAWYYQNSNGTPHEVGQKDKNLWGIYDMQGNVSEWCIDSFSSQGVTRFETQKKSDIKVVKGGDFGDIFLYPSERGCLRKNSETSRIGFRIIIE